MDGKQNFEENNNLPANFADINDYLLRLSELIEDENNYTGRHEKEADNSKNKNHSHLL